MSIMGTNKLCVDGASWLQLQAIGISKRGRRDLYRSYCTIAMKEPAATATAAAAADWLSPAAVPLTTGLCWY